MDTFSNALKSFRDFINTEVRVYVKKDKRSQVRFANALMEFSSEDHAKSLLEKYCRHDLHGSINYLLDHFLVENIPDDIVKDIRVYLELLIMVKDE